MKLKRPIVFINYPPVRVSLDVLWYDAWIGAFWDRKQKTLYVCPLPCVVLKIEFGPPTNPPTPLADDAQYANAIQSIFALPNPVTDENGNYIVLGAKERMQNILVDPRIYDDVYTEYFTAAQPDEVLP